MTMGTPANRYEVTRERVEIGCQTGLFTTQYTVTIDGFGRPAVFTRDEPTTDAQAYWFALTILCG